MSEDFSAFVARWRVPFGFALGIAFVVFAQPTLPLLIAGSLLALAGVGIRAYAAGHLEKDQCLATGGPYAYTRNPLYLGSLLIGLGLVVAGAQWVLGVVFLFFFLVVYGPVMRREERNLRRHFGEEFDNYSAAVPLFFPSRRRLNLSGTKFEWKRYRRNREYEAALGYLGGVIFLLVKSLLR
ncbi:MAG TPA: methyltransferase [Terriglobia bacterium]|nr:methyltransferase [Terriglobia bacterium]